MRLFVIGALLTAATCGCGSRAETTQRASAQTAIDHALRASAEKNFEVAERLWSDAITLGGLDGDQYVQAHLERALCRARLGRYDSALADLQQIEPLAPNLDEVYVARAFVFARQGDSAAAKAQLAKARKLNAQVEAIRD